MWGEVQTSWLEVLYPDTPNPEIAAFLGRSVSSIQQKARQLGLEKAPAFYARPENTGRFQEGHVSWNCGRHFDPGGRAAETRFKAGHKPHTWQPIGTEVTDPKDGYLKRKIRDDAKPATYNWAFVHRLVWEEANGPIPDGHVIVFRDGNRTNVDLGNLECIHRADLARRNTVWNRYPREVAEAIHLRGQLRRRIREKQERQS